MMVSDNHQGRLIIKGAEATSIKRLVFFIIIIAYVVYYAVIFLGFMKNDFIVEDESATRLQRAVAFITPLSLRESNQEVREQN